MSYPMVGRGDFRRCSARRSVPVRELHLDPPRFSEVTHVSFHGRFADWRGFTVRLFGCRIGSAGAVAGSRRQVGIAFARVRRIAIRAVDVAAVVRSVALGSISFSTLERSLAAYVLGESPKCRAESIRPLSIVLDRQAAQRSHARTFDVPPKRPFAVARERVAPEHISSEFQSTYNHSATERQQRGFTNVPLAERIAIFHA